MKPIPKELLKEANQQLYSVARYLEEQWMVKEFPLDTVWEALSLLDNEVSSTD